MKKIIMINCYGYPPGVSQWTRHYDLSKNLIKEGYEVDLITSSYVHGMKTQQKLDVEEINKVRFHKIKNKGFTSSISRIISEIQFMMGSIKYCKKNIKKPNIVYGTSPGLFNVLAAYILSLHYKAKFVFEVRDIWPETWVEMGVVNKKNPIYIFFRILEKFLYKKADRIITLLPGVYKHLEKSGISKDKSSWVSNGVDINQFDINAKKYSSPFTFEENKFNILYTGGIGRANVLHNLIEVSKKLENNFSDKISINIVGKGPLERELKEMSKELSCIKFWGSIEKNKIPNLLEKADCLIAIMKKGNLYKYGISLNKSFEYLASKKPIIFSGNVLNDFVKEGNAGISVNAEEIDEIYEAILKLYNMSKEERDEIGKNGRRYVEENYDIPILAIKLKKVLDEL